MDGAKKSAAPDSVTGIPPSDAKRKGLLQVAEAFQPEPDMSSPARSKRDN